MNFKYLWGAVLSNLYRLLRVFPNSDPIMGFVIPAAKNEAWWKAPLFAFATMFVFDFFTSGIGPWTYVTATTYALIALYFVHEYRSKKASLRNYLGSGVKGVLAFDLITGPLMSTFLFGNSFIVTTMLQIPFTLMHLISAGFAVLIITPMLDKEVAKEVSLMRTTVINSMRRWGLQL